MAAKGISEGDFEQRTYIRTGDELQDLGSSFNKTAERLKKSNEEMLKANQSQGHFFSEYVS